MSIVDDMERFLEERLDEFLKDHPYLELQILEDKLRDQEMGTLRLIQDLKREEKQHQGAILATAEEVQRWHGRVSKAKQAGRQDLMQAAQEREAALLRQGNQQWGQMELTRQRLQQTQTLFQQIQRRRQEVKAKIQAQKTTPQPEGSAGWYQPRPTPGADPLEDQFRQWEIEADLQDLKRRMGQ
ncbi:TIGR04376 family protein [Lyngbya confervoides]|uniref:TIGR04376 family protein n=1 Tax=Lyngbya confervoides BDU141951 TaxID=1574623 RepID=A0ABD4T2C8_9CYAN|nr:TIGR04376 family protein [Lyngbya confervoides]MCM1982809.1 TIGR04376 family protein [Lyngbya confervoides BDU141951]